MGISVPDIILFVHLAWATTMVAGFVLAVLGIFWPRLRGFVVFRTAHVIGIMLTASVPLWSGLCPLTIWEYSLRGDRPDASRSFLADLASDILYVNVPIWVITLVTTVVAVSTVILYIVYPPWRCRPKRLTRN